MLICNTSRQEWDLHGEKDIFGWIAVGPVLAVRAGWDHQIVILMICRALASTGLWQGSWLLIRQLLPLCGILNSSDSVNFLPGVFGPFWPMPVPLHTGPANLSPSSSCYFPTGANEAKYLSLGSVSACPARYSSSFPEIECLDAAGPLLRGTVLLVLNWNRLSHWNRWTRWIFNPGEIM